MEVHKSKDGAITVLSPEGRIDTTTAKQFEAAVMGAMAENNKIIVAFSKLDYISSAGLRVMLMAQKKMNATKGTLVLTELPTNVHEVFKMSGFDKILKICGTMAESKQLFN